MGRFFKVFFITFFVSILLLMVGFYSYLKVFDPLDDITKVPDGIDLGEDDDIEDDPNATPFERAKKNSKRINVLLVGLEHVRTDTIMVASFDKETKEANIFSVPRDTLYVTPEYKAGYTKINAIYQYDKIGGLIDAVQNILDIKIHRYVTVDYEAVIKGIDALGGVEVDIPFRMKYTDIYSDPPLYIDIPEGRRLLDGKTSVEYLRFRKGDDGYKSYVDGDIGRTRAQQQFVKEVVKKLISLKLGNFINEVYPYIKTNFSTTELLALGALAPEFSMDKLSTITLPGNETGSSYYALNKEEVLKLMYEMYGVLENEEASANE